MAVTINNTIVAADVAPAISIDLTSNLVEGIRSLQEILGITDMQPMAAGTTVNIYDVVRKGDLNKQTEEGKTVPLTEYERKIVRTVSLSLDFYRKLVTAQAIQKSGREAALYDTDKKLIAEVRKDIKGTFYTALDDATGVADSKATLQAQLAAGWGKLHSFYEDIDSNPVHFVNPEDVADYLGSASITTQNAFGFDYVEDFLGLGTVIFSGNIGKGKVVSTAKENLRGVYVPANGEVGTEFELTSDESGLVGMTHTKNTSEVGIESLLMAGVKFYPENLAGVFVGTFGDVSA